MSYDLVIRNGSVIDGSGLPRYRADVGVKHGRIAEIGRIRERAAEVIDAEGLIVAPGFVDGHTHMDAQIAWDPLGTSSCWHGITSVIMGNCGFTLAPCRAADRELFAKALEAVEDIPAESMMAGIDWQWETYPEYLDTLERLPKGINYGGYVGHSALRMYAMGERAFSEPATPDDLGLMRRQLRDAVRAGAMGLSTSRSPNHVTPQRTPVPSRIADWDEVCSLVGVLGEVDAGIFEIAGEDVGPDATAERWQDYAGRLRALAVETARPITFGVFSRRRTPDLWKAYFKLAEDTAAAGGRMFLQVHSRALNLLLSFKTHMPFDRLSVWRELRAQPLSEQRRALQDPEVRRRLVDAAQYKGGEERPIGAEARRPDYDWLFVMNGSDGPYRSVSEVARERGQDPVETMIELALAKDLDQFFVQPVANEDQAAALEMMQHPRSVVTFSDSGAHVAQIMDSSLQTHVLSHWVRKERALTLEEAVRMVTFEPASAWGLHDRGLLRPGLAADITVFDADRIGPAMPEVAADLPAGAKRLVQRAQGIAATVVNGQVVLRDGQHTGAYPGQVLRGPLARR